MELISVNLGRRQRHESGEGGYTGIYKQPVPHPVRLFAGGVEGDAVCDHRHHGGLDQAVYVYGWPDYHHWSTLLGRDLAPGTFGENLTISELESASLGIGDRLRIGDVLLEVTAPRIPCNTLARRMGDPKFVKRFVEVERPGVYCRVLEPGAVQSGTPVTLEPYAGDTVTVLEMYRDFLHPELTAGAIRRFLAAPIAQRARDHKQRQLEKLLGG